MIRGFSPLGDCRIFAKSSGIMSTSVLNEEASGGLPCGEARVIPAGAATIGRIVLLMEMTSARKLRVPNRTANLMAF